MRTTFLNPTVWLLLTVIVSALAGARQRRTASQSLLLVLAHATRWPVLLVLIALAAGGLVSRAVLGYLSPGAYAEEVVSARAFLDQRKLYGTNARAELSEWLAEDPSGVDVWALPGIGACEANAMTARPQFFTSNAHPPTVLLASVPVVRATGGRGLYTIVLLTTLAAIVAMIAVLLSAAAIGWRSRAGLLMAAAVAGWQPVVASVRQGDVVLIAAALVTLAWHFGRRHSSRAGVCAGIAAALAVPAIGATAALLRLLPRSGLLAAGILAGGLAAVAAAAGPLILPDFIGALTTAASTYAPAPMNYAVVGRFAGSGVTGGALALAAAACLWLTVRYARTLDTTFAALVTFGLVLSPLLWSQHLTLAVVPLAVLLGHVLRQDSSLPLAAWAVLAMLFSLPDPAFVDLSAILMPVPASGAPPSLAPLLPLALWIALLWTGRRVASAPDTAREPAPVAAR